MFGSITGIITGVVVWGFKWCASYLEGESAYLYGWFRENPTFIPLLFCGLIVLALFSAVMNKFIPELRTNSISNAEGAMRGMLKYKWPRTIFGTIASSFLSYFGGLTFGAEGPSVQLGAAIGQASNGLGHFLDRSSPAWKRYNITGGAAAGFAVAFGAPLSGIIYTLEEAHKRISPMLLMTALSSVIFASVVSGLLDSAVGNAQFFFSGVESVFLPFENYWVLLIMGVISGLIAALFNKLFALATKFRSDKLKKLPTVVRILFIFLLTGVVGLLMVDAIGGGHAIIDKVLELDFTWQILLILFFVRIVLLILTSNSGAMGGMFVPVLTIGALLGGLLGKMSIEMGLPADYYQTVVLITMTAFMGAVMRAPITAILLIVEMTGHFSSGFLATAISVLIAYLIVEMLKIEPLYEKALHDAYKDVNKDKGHKQVYEFNTIVEKGSFVEGRQVKDILWPYGCTISTVIKTDEVGNEIYSTDKAGDRIIRAGQTYIVKALVYDIEQTKKEMEYLCKNYSYKETADMGVENAREMFGIKNFKKRKDKEKSNSDSVNETRSEDGDLRNSNGNESDDRICGTLNSEKSAEINSDGKESFGALSETVQTACVDDTEGDRTEEKHNDGKD